MKGYTIYMRYETGADPRINNEWLRNPFEIEGLELINPNIPHLMISNHPNILRIAPFLLNIGRKLPNLTVVCDAAFSPFLKTLHFDTIEVNSPHKVRYAKDAIEEFTIRTTRLLGKTLHAYHDDNSQNGAGVVNRITSAIETKRSVLLFPAGRSEKSAIWRPGVGSVLKQLSKNQIDYRVAFAHIDRSSFKNKIAGVFSTLDLFESTTLENSSPETLTHQLQTLYGSQVDILDY